MTAEMYEYPTPAGRDPSPITLRRESGWGVHLVIREDWLEKLEPLYLRFQLATGAVSVKTVPPPLDAAVDLINEFILNFKLDGWIISLSILYLLKMAASGAIRLGRLVYRGLGYGRNFGTDYGKARSWVVENVD